jgi:Uncharacterized enzyme of heme biosynthesis
MHNYLSRFISLTLMLLFISTLPVGGQEKQGLSEEEFLNQYRAALQEGNKQKAEQLVRENKDHTKTVAESLLNQAIKAFQMADYETALEVLNTSLELYRQLGDKAGEGVTLSSIGLVYYSTGDYQKALSYYQDALKIMRGRR